jgi:hypothetical protein
MYIIAAAIKVRNWLKENGWGELAHQVCATKLAHGLSVFTEQEMRLAPVLDPRFDGDACHPPSLFARLGEYVRGSLAHYSCREMIGVGS